MTDALQMLRDDHKKVKDLFQQFEEAEDTRTKKSIVDTAIMELQIHTRLEEEIFYPAMRRQGDIAETMNEAEEEHRVVDLLIAELRKMRPADKQYAAKFTVLAENVKHHIHEEESEMLPKAAEAGMPALQRLGEQMMRRKQELMRRGATRRRNGASTNGRTTRKAAPATKRKPRTTSRRSTTSKRRTATARVAAPRTAAKRATPKRAASTTRKRATPR